MSADDIEFTDPDSGEVARIADQFALVPLNLAALDEDELLAMFPTPVQLTGALVIARFKNARGPAAIAGYREALRVAERELKVALGMAVLELRREHPRVTLTELRDMAHGTVERVKRAQETVDTAWLQLAYAKDFAAALAADIEILRSLNANLRTELAGPTVRTGSAQ